MSAVRKWLAAAIIALASACATVRAGKPDPLPTAKFRARPVRVMASADMSPDCRAATYSAVLWYIGLGATVTITWVPEDHPAISLEPREGEVSIHAGLPTTPNALAETYTWYTLGGDVARAEIVCGYCSPWVLAHELGHALGLQHRFAGEALMHKSDERGGWGLSPMERAWIHD